MASNFYATYTAGTYVAQSPAEAVEMAKDDYRNSSSGRALKDVGAFRFYVAKGGPVASSDE